ncbi:lipopolysaccharide biosynthesis protein [Dolichospermum circinale]|uniref:lipopolysaccharide biosynthesis protein n=1 Tax=Dolichospermum circinale TaxID=109265 RepID=UPI00232C567D|nr:polysaccharide biosynthesis protein [Dolichospermum circinale]MDB9467031.1 polysaccharide biosynthesis protein [Dolichospermum circinale CS-539/09]MDB9472350.1 polysaccharide biosynthesis protein [Dolichospermum circinale CS-539]
MLPSKIQYWIKTLTKFISIQLIVQALNLASGILIIRLLSKQEYAYFTLANAMQAAMNVLADSGIGSALSAIGGRVWQDPYRFGQLINTAMYLRRYLAVIATLVVTPILFWMLLQNGASIGYTVILIVGILLELYFYLEIGVLNTVLRLHTQIDRIQRLALSGAGSRLAILGGAFNFLNAGVGVFASTIASWLQAMVLRSWSRNIISTKASVSQDDRKEILKIVASQVPNSIYFCVQSQLAVLLISIFGNTQNIAEIGALSRLGIIFSLITSVMAEIVLPNFARCQTPSILFRRYLQILGLYSLFSVALVGLAFLFPSQFLWILGGKYSHLQREVVLLVINLVMQSVLSLTWSLNSSKGWMLSGWLSIPVGIITQVILLMILDVSTIKGIFMLNTLSTLPGFVLLFHVAYSGFSKMESEITSL